ncbi:MAG: HlyD family type I secretion periplasmic adaptor subunit [Desulfobacterales bacterium]|nr:HlyD family type I secretion periplasmic adaptor subunit [Desulfobacterales bacterium]
MFSFKSQDDGHEFKPLLVEIDEEPVNPLGRTVFWIVIAAILFTCLWMYIGQVDIIVTARGKIIPRGEIKTLQPLTTGVVRSIFIRPGDYVTKGMVVMEIDPSGVDPELISLQSDFDHVKIEMERISALLENRPMNFTGQDHDSGVLQVQEAIYASEKKRLALQVQVKLESLAQLDERLAVEQNIRDHTRYMADILSQKLQRLEKVKDIISQDKYDQTSSELKKYTGELTASGHRTAELNALKTQTVKELTYIKEEFRNALLAELSAKKQHSLFLKSQIEKTEFISARQQIKAPVDGFISQLFVHTVGGVVTPAEKLAHIVPSNSPLQVKALLLNKDAGFVTENMKVSIKIDTFDFQKYGLLDGTILQVSKDSMEDERLGLVYETFIVPEQTSMVVDGKDVPISAGMSVTAEIKVGRRRIIEFFIYPLIKHLDEGMSVK